MTNLCDDEGYPSCPMPHVCIVSVARTPEEIKDEIETLQDCGDMDPAYIRVITLRLEHLDDELEQITNR